MAEFKVGAVDYPLTTDLTNSELREFDPALYFTIDFFAAMIRHYVGPALIARAAGIQMAPPSAVVQTISVAPEPLRGDQFKFPALAVFRTGSEFSQKTLVWGQDVSEWEFAYILPSLVATRQREKLEPFLHTVANTLRAACRSNGHPTYESGLDVWQAAGIERIEIVNATYGSYQPIDETDKLYRAVYGKIAVAERITPTSIGGEPFTGFDVNIDHKQGDGTTLPDVVEFRTQQPPAFTSIVPNNGSKAGGTSFEIIGDRFWKPAQVLFEGGDPIDVEVVDEQHITGVTPAHAANPTFIGDVTVINGDGQRVRAPAAFTFTSP